MRPLCVYGVRKIVCVNVNLFGYSSPSAARLRGCEAARLRGCEAANFARYAVLCQVLLQNFCAVFCENVYCFYRCVSLPSQLQYNLFLCEFQREAACAHGNQFCPRTV